MIRLEFLFSSLMSLTRCFVTMRNSNIIQIYVNDQSCATMTSTDNLTFKDCQCFRISILRFVCLLWFLCHDDGLKLVVLIKCDLLRPPIQEARASCLFFLIRYWSTFSLTVTCNKKSNRASLLHS